MNVAIIPARGGSKRIPRKNIKIFSGKPMIDKRPSETPQEPAEKKENLWANIHKKRQRIKQGSGERMRKKGEKGAPTAAQMKRAQGEQMEAYDIGHDYAQHTTKMTPGQVGYDPKHQGDTYKPSTPENNNKRVFKSFKDYNENDVKEKDVKEWAMSDATIDKYKERYKELWREKLNEVVKRMMDKI